MRLNLPPSPLIPQPIADEHGLSLAHGYIRLNSANPKCVFKDVIGAVFRNKGFNYYYLYPAALFAPVLDEQTFFERHYFDRLKKSFARPAYYRGGVTEFGLSARARSNVAEERKTWLHSEQYFLFCPECRDHDISYHGYARWRRSHQIRGVIVCPDHGCLLVATCAQCKTAPGKVLMPEVDSQGCAHCGSAYPIKYPAGSNTNPHLLFAGFVQAILAGKVAPFNLKLMVDVLTTTAMERFGVSENAVPARLRRAIEKVFPPVLLRSIGLDSRIDAGAGWLRWFFAGESFTDDFQAHALIGAVLFESLDEWMEVYTFVAKMHWVAPWIDSVAHTPITPRLLKSLAWQSSLECVTGSRILECIPGLERVRQSQFIKTKEAMLPLLQQALHESLKTKSKYKVEWALYEAEDQVMLRRREVVCSALVNYSHPESRKQGSVSTNNHVGVDGIEAQEEVAESHP